MAFATVFLEIPSCLAISAFGNFSLTCNLRIKAQSSKVITSPSWMGAHFPSVTPAQSSSGIDTTVVTYITRARKLVRENLGNATR